MGKIKYSLFLKFIAVVLAVALLANPVFSASADSGKGKYVEDVILMTRADYADACETARRYSAEAGKTYYVIQEPIHTFKNGTAAYSTFLAYSTTDTPGKAITSIKAMNMEGGWSYDEYDKYLERMIEQTTLMVNDFLVAIREYNTNLAAKKPNTVYAKGILDLYIYDDLHESLSEFFAKAGTVESAKQYPKTDGFKTAEEAAEYKANLQKFILEANVKVVCTVENALMLACNESYNGVGANLFRGMEQNYFMQSIDQLPSNPDIHSYDSYVDIILASLPEAQSDIKYYMNSNHMYTAEMEQMAFFQEEELELDEKASGDVLQKHFDDLMDVREFAARADNPYKLDKKMFQAAQDLYAYEVYFAGLSSENQQKYSTGRMLYETLAGCEYKGYLQENGKRQYSNLLELIMKYDLNNPTEKSGYEKKDFYPLINAMTPGQRGMLMVGFTQFVSSVVTPTELLKMNKAAAYAAYNYGVDKSEKITEKDPISVFFGVDRSLFQKDSGIALTDESIKMAQERPFGTRKVSKLEKVADILMIASGATAAYFTCGAIGCAIGMTKTFTAALIAQGGGDLGAAAGVVANYNQFAYEVVFANATEEGSAILAKVSVEAGSEKAGVSFSNCFKAFMASKTGLAFQAVIYVAIAVFLISATIKIVEYLKSIYANNEYKQIPRVMCAYEDLKTDGEKDYVYYYGVKSVTLDSLSEEFAGDKANIYEHRVGDIYEWSLKGGYREWVALYYTRDVQAGDPILSDSLMLTTDANAINSGYVGVKKFNEGAPYNLLSYYGLSVGNIAGNRKYLAYKMDTAAGFYGSVFSNISPIGALVAGVLAGGTVSALITYFITRKRRRKNEIVEA